MGSSRVAGWARARRPTWTTRPDPADTTYGGELFRRAGSFLQRRAGGHPGSDVDPAATAPPPGSWWSDLGGALALARLAAALPVADVALTDSAAGDALRTALAGRTLGVPRNRLCAAVFSVPDAVAERPSGKHHQALRTALTAAARAGLRVRTVDDVAERTVIAADAARRVPRLTSWSLEAPGLVEHDWWVAEDADGVVAGIATVAVDAEWASLVTLFGLPGRDTESHARFLLHHTVVRALSAAGVRRLAVLDHSPLLLAPGPQHLQRVLGYRPTRLRRPVHLTARAPRLPVTAVASEVRPAVVTRPAVAEVAASGRARV